MTTNQPKASIVIGDYRGVLMTFSEKASVVILPYINQLLEIIESCRSYDENKKYVFARQGDNVNIMLNQMVFSDLLWEIQVRILDIDAIRDFAETPWNSDQWCKVEEHEINRSVEVINPSRFIHDLNQLLIEKKLELDFNLAATTLLSAYGHSFIESEINPEDRSNSLAIAEDFKATVTYDDGTSVKGLDYSIFGPHILLFIGGNDNKLIGYLHCRVKGDDKFFSLLLKGFIKNKSGSPDLPTRISNWLNSIGVPVERSTIDDQLSNIFLSPIKKISFSVDGKEIKINYSAMQISYLVQVETPDLGSQSRSFTD